MHLKMLSAKWRPSCFGLNVLKFTTKFQSSAFFIFSVWSHKHGNWTQKGVKNVDPYDNMKTIFWKIKIAFIRWDNDNAVWFL